MTTSTKKTSATAEQAKTAKTTKAAKTGKAAQPAARPSKASVRERIFRAALALITKDGPGAASARAICAKARITAPTLYRHFADLSSLYDEVLKVMYVPEAQAHPGREYSDPEGMINYMWDCIIGTAISNPGIVDLKNQLVATGAVPESMMQFYARLEIAFEELGRRERLFYPPKVASVMYWGAAIGMARMIASARHGGPKCSPISIDGLHAAVLKATLRPTDDQP